MLRQTGRTVTITTTGEKVEAFIPHPLPPAKPPLDMARLSELNARAEEALQKLNGMASLAPSVEWLVYGAVRREALLTSLIEGTQATLTDLFDAEADVTVSNPQDVEEVTNYLRALSYVREQRAAPNGLPISTRLLCEAHRELMTGTRGRTKQPGEIRTSQNWIGGTRPGNAVHVPPPPGELAALMSDLEKFIHGPASQSPLPPLVKIGLIHAQFETIHPFLDGNGRIGRLLIAMLLEDWGLLDEPLLAISTYLKQHQQAYYRGLASIRSPVGSGSTPSAVPKGSASRITREADNIRKDGDWEGWSAFFLEAVEQAAKEAVQSITALAGLIREDRTRLLAQPGVTPAAARLFELLPGMPRFNSTQAQAKLGATAPTVNAAIAVLEQAGIVVEVTGRKRGRVFSYAGYVQKLTG